MLIPTQQTVSRPGQNWWSCEAFCSTAIRGILCMCEVSWSHATFQSNQSMWTRYLQRYCGHTGGIMVTRKLLWSRGSYHPTSTITKPPLKVQHCYSIPESSSGKHRNMAIYDVRALVIMPRNISKTIHNGSVGKLMPDKFCHWFCKSLNGHRKQKFRWSLNQMEVV